MESNQIKKINIKVRQQTHEIEQPKIIREKYISSKEICKIYNITSRTLLNWCYAGKIKFIRTKGNHRRYINPEYNGHIYKYCYCRSQDPDSLSKQIEHMKKTYPGYEIISDIGTGNDSSREGFGKILDFAIDGRISELIIPTKDTLSTNGFDIIEKIIKKYSNGEIIVSNNKLAIVEFIE